MIIKGAEILNRLIGEGNWITIVGADYDTIVLQEGISMPSKEDFDRVKLEVEQFIESQSYKQLREKEYPEIKDQLDMLYHDKIDGTNTWLNTIQAVKDKYPKS